MQNKSNFISKCFLLSIVFSIFFAVAQLLLMYFNFNFDTGFFKSKTLSTLLYFAFLLTITLFYIFSKKKNTGVIQISSKSNIRDIFCACIFAFFAISNIANPVSQGVETLELITWYVSTLFAFLSVIYYVINCFMYNKISNSLLSLLNLSPVIYLISQLVYSFATLTGKANSLHTFPSLFSLLIVSYYILNSGKERFEIENPDKATPMLSVSLITIISIAFSAVPNFVLYFTKDYYTGIVDIVLLLLEFIYFVDAIKYNISLIQNTEKENK